ncbi:Predicted ATPase [Bradyrhizobium lablabi]|uniref:Predicted ATPase n=1 Tax=Bradyrhizobium lablabi TaxID=722472 RepID=A0A1M6XVF7_9BRAD|nr:winged helix-turn-helix domain-containing protein [Bradyrhizobium lablabi]SHL09971.1 Predicted ATPase [Bradyrhizobium lablabi]
MRAHSGRLVYELDEWEVDLARRELRARGVPVPIGGRAFEIIEVLVRSAGELVTKNDLSARVWPGAIVEENTLQFHISAIRKALGSDRGLLKTASGRGYRLIGAWTSRQECTLSGDSIDLEPMRSPAEPFQTNLPAAASELVGRTNAMQHLRGLLSAYRVVTLTGPGGIGKTRLALEVARGLFPSFQGDVRLVELVSLSDPALVPTAVTGGLGLKFGGDEISAESVARAIGAQRLLLVLDNCEHVIDAAARLVETIVRMCSRTTILATSREILKIEGEYVYRVPPLDVPSQHEEPDDILGRSAVQLFIATTRALHSDFPPNGENLAAIAAICRRLDGIPLAIDFAATRVATLGLQQVAASLNDHLGMLTGGRRTALPRHQTLRATLDWSYELLPEPERLVMRRLAVFAGDFTAEAAGSVAAAGEISVSEAVCSLANLVTKSLVTLEAGGVIAHHRLHETTRGYALEKLVESGEFDQVACRHANYYRDLFDRAEIELETLPPPAWLARYGHQIGQVRAALDWAFSPAGDAEVGVALTVAAVPLWVHLSLTEECRGRVERALSGPAESRDARRNMQLYAALGAALFLTKGSCPEMVAAFASAFEIAESLDDTDYRLRALWGAFMEHITSLRYRAALAVAVKFCSYATKSTDPADGLIGDRLAGVALLALGELESARRHIERMMGRYVARTSHTIRFQFDQQLLAHSYHCRILWLQGFPDQALRSIESHLVAARTSDHPYSLFSGLLQTACPVALLVGDLTLAERYVKALMDLSARHAVELWTLGGRCFGGMLLIKRGDIGAGLEFLRAAFARVPQGAFTLFYTPVLAEIGDALGRDGKAAEGLSIIDEALARSDSNEERWCVAELLRIKGELILREGAPQAAAAAEEHFLRSLDWARRQGALSWELRTSTSLALLQYNQGRIAESRSLLQPVYDRFSEGFETADLKTAKAYLNSWK